MPTTPVLRVRINYIDTTTARPGPLDNGEKNHVPMIRIFGTSSLGYSTCLHIHQVYPYFYIPYIFDTSPDAVRAFSDNLRKSLDIALRSLAPGKHKDVDKPFVKRIMLVKGIDFYGFHTGYAPFLKIYMYDTRYVQRAVTILLSGTIMGTRFIAYESHLNFDLQFMCDFALYGCNWLDLGPGVLVRGNCDVATNLNVSPYMRETALPLELDACAYQILNRHVVPPRNVHHLLTIPALPPPEEPFISSVRELWEDERQRRIDKGLTPTPQLPDGPSQGSRGKGGDWEEEEALRDALRARIMAENGSWKDREPAAWEEHVMTAYESIDALWDKDQRATRTTPAVPPLLKVTQEPGVVIDESALLSPAFREEIQNEADIDALAGHEVSELFRPDSPREENILAEVHELSSPRRSTPSSSADRVIYQQVLSPGQLFNDFSPSRTGPPRRKRARFTTDPWSAFGIQSQPQTQDRTPTSSQSGVSCFTYAFTAPSRLELLSTLDEHHLRHTVYRDPYYSNANDAPKRLTERDIDGLVFDLRAETIGQWDDGVVWRDQTFDLDPRGVGGWEFAGGAPPKMGEVRRWLAKQTKEAREVAPPSTYEQLRPQLRSQIEGPTQKTESQSQGPAHIHENAEMSAIAVEVFAPSKDYKSPNPKTDPIAAVFYAFFPSSSATFDDTSSRRQIYVTGVIAVRGATIQPGRLRDLPIQIVDSELDLLNATIDKIRQLDPDILSGWEVQSASYGYLKQRGEAIGGLDVLDLLSRAPGAHNKKNNHMYAATHTSIIRVVGRHVLNVWRILRSDMALSSYTFENFAFHILKRRMPNYSPGRLTEWYNSTLPMHNSRVLRYFADRVACLLDILDARELVAKTAEFARVFGIDFFAVISRGSQYKVESFLFRIGKPENFIIMSPSRAAVGKQNAIYAIPLILEPHAAFYSSPMVVLDFQSLYPSVMIAYNYCYSTCLGRIKQQNGQWKFGVLDNFELPPGLLGKVEDYINVAPNGIAYVKPEVRSGLLGRMLKELLETRVMVKQGMKLAKGNKGLLRTLDARQLSLKFICNVTYGYTSATFSGRMPAVEIADSIVQSGRETLNNAMRTIENTAKWGAKVVYGDTDSVFVYLPGRTKDQAFRIGHEIADTITAQNPDPIKLKFEKVFFPSVLMAKKRYVGFAYEHPDQGEPIFDAKGIETVRRDFTPATQKMMETSLKMLFRSQDLSAIKKYCVRTWQKIQEERVSLKDFIFAKEVRMGTYSEDKASPPGVMVAARAQIDDPNDEAQYGDRVKYLMPRPNHPGERLVELATAPLEYMEQGMHLHTDYYIDRMLIRPLDRVFRLVGVDIRRWYNEMPKTRKVWRSDVRNTSNRDKIVGHFHSAQCIACQHSGMLVEGLCEGCRNVPQRTLRRLERQLRVREKRVHTANLVCMSCTGSVPGEQIDCQSLDCEWLYERHKVVQNMQVVDEFEDAIAFLVARDREPDVIILD